MFEAGLALRCPTSRSSPRWSRGAVLGQPDPVVPEEPESLQKWLYLNPFHGILDFYRAAVWPDVLTSWVNYALSFGVILVIFIAGIVMLGKGLNLRRME